VLNVQEVAEKGWRSSAKEIRLGNGMRVKVLAFSR
jgi:hypothetical protein